MNTKKFNVTVNGVSYEVEVEEVAAFAEAPAAVPATAPAAPKAAAPTVPAAPAAPKAAPAPAAPAVSSGSVGSTKIKAPMPGTIVKVGVNVGDTVKKGGVMLVLEAMKMENEICAPADGVVASVNVAKGTGVSTDQLLLTLN